MSAVTNTRTEESFNNKISKCIKFNVFNVLIVIDLSINNECNNISLENEALIEEYDFLAFPSTHISRSKLPKSWTDQTFSFSTTKKQPLIFIYI